MAPQILYWAIFGDAESVDPVRWGFSFAPWMCAWLTGLAISGAVIGIGHYTRYRPGLVWVITAVVLAIAVLLFQSRISFAELDYQLYIAGNNPEEVPEFYDYDLNSAIDEVINDPATKSSLAEGFWSSEPILLRKELIADIQNLLAYDRWPAWWVNIPSELKYQAKRQWLLNQYDLFIEKRPISGRLAIALYYKAILNEYMPDIRLIGQSELLHFSSDYPRRENLPIWNRIYKEFSQSGEALEARCRIAMHQAGRGEFEKATDFCDAAEIMLSKQLKLIDETHIAGDTLLTVFAEPATTVMTSFKLKELRHKLRKLIKLISMENRTDDEDSRKRLAKFVMLNPHRLDYSQRLDILLAETKKNDRLRDNILLAKIMLIPDAQLRGEQLKELSEKYKKTDGGTQALYELGLLNVGLWKDPKTSEKEKNKYLSDARKILTDFTSKYPHSIFSEQAQTMLNSLPSAE